MKKLVLILVLALILISGCNQNDLFIVKDNTKLPSNICNNLEKTIFIYETGCRYCEQAMPRVQELDRELQMNIRYLNLLNQDDRDYMLNNKFSVLNVPTLIHDCRAYTGLKSLEEYREILKNG